MKSKYSSQLVALRKAIEERYGSAGGVRTLRYYLPPFHRDSDDVRGEGLLRIAENESSGSRKFTDEDRELMARAKVKLLERKKIEEEALEEAIKKAKDEAGVPENFGGIVVCIREFSDADFPTLEKEEPADKDIHCIWQQLKETHGMTDKDVIDKLQDEGYDLKGFKPPKPIKSDLGGL